MADMNGHGDLPPDLLQQLPGEHLLHDPAMNMMSGLQLGVDVEHAGGLLSLEPNLFGMEQQLQHPFGAGALDSGAEEQHEPYLYAQARDVTQHGHHSDEYYYYDPSAHHQSGAHQNSGSHHGARAPHEPASGPHPHPSGEQINLNATPGYYYHEPPSHGPMHSGMGGGGLGAPDGSQGLGSLAGQYYGNQHYAGGVVSDHSGTSYYDGAGCGQGQGQPLYSGTSSYHDYYYHSDQNYHSDVGAGNKWGSAVDARMTTDNAKLHSLKHISANEPITSARITSRCSSTVLPQDESDDEAVLPADEVEFPPLGDILVDPPAGSKQSTAGDNSSAVKMVDVAALREKIQVRRKTKGAIEIKHLDGKLCEDGELLSVTELKEVDFYLVNDFVFLRSQEQIAATIAELTGVESSGSGSEKDAGSSKSSTGTGHGSKKSSKASSSGRNAAVGVGGSNMQNKHEDAQQLTPAAARTGSASSKHSDASNYSFQSNDNASAPIKKYKVELRVSDPIPQKLFRKISQLIEQARQGKCEVNSISVSVDTYVPVSSSSSCSASSSDGAVGTSSSSTGVTLAGNFCSTVLQKLKAQSHTRHITLRGLAIGKGMITESLETLRLQGVFNWLETLELSGNGIADVGFKAIVDCVLQPSGVHLKKLICRQQGITKAGVAALCSCIEEAEDLCKLKVLDLSGNQIGFEGADKIGDMLLTNASIQELSIRRNCCSGNFWGGGLFKIVNALSTGRNQTLESLDLGQNEIRDKAAGKLAELWGKSALKHLYLEGNPLPESVFTQIVDNLERNDTLETLNIGCARVKKMSALRLGNVLKNVKTLKKLYLHRNAFGKSGAAAIFEALKVNKSIVKLDLRENEIGCNGAVAAAAMISGNSTLKYLSLQNNKIGEKGCMALANALRENYVLHVLSLQGNDLSPDAAHFLSAALQQRSTGGSSSESRGGDVGSRAGDGGNGELVLEEMQ